MSPRKPRSKPQANAGSEPEAVATETAAEPQPEKRAVPADWPRLEALFGLGKAKDWGLALARDIADYKAGVISWTDVDRGCVLGGEPGTGKTTFAKALAATCNVPLVATSYSVWQRYREGHLGNVLTAIHDDFKRAIDSAPSILFIDEIDSIPSRANESLRYKEWWDSIVAALLQELDGMTSRNGVVVIAACNYPDRIDPALVRAGRLDTRIIIDLPSIGELAGIIRFHLGKDLPDADLRPVAISAAGMTGADIEKLVRDARRRARSDKRDLELADLFEMLEHNEISIPPECLKRVALHEAGHAAAAILLNLSSNVTTSLMRRGRLVAETSFAPRFESITRKVVENKITVALAGRAAEDVLLGDVTAGSGGAENSDLAIATSLAVRAVGSWGLSSSSNLIYSGDTAPEQLWTWRPELAEEVDAMLKAAYTNATELITTHREAVRAIAAALIDRRALTHDEIATLLPPPQAEGPAGYAASAP
jgi:ATP-dependent Zn protease